MPIQLPRPTIRLLIMAVAVLAVPSARVLPRLRQPAPPPPPPAPPRIRYLEILQRQPDGSVRVISHQGYNLDTPPVSGLGRSHYAPGRDGSLREAIEDAKVGGFGYRVTVPIAFTDSGQPDYGRPVWGSSTLGPPPLWEPVSPPGEMVEPPPG